jgi:phenylacetic acid degradation operon negative regulatory protein
LLQAAELDDYVTWFAAQHLTEVDVATWWDLTALRSQYTAFLTRHRGRLEHTALPDDQAFAGYLGLIDEWRLFPRLDPGLPESLLPPNWPAREAWELFQTLHTDWAAAGLRHVRSVVAATG